MFPGVLQQPRQWQDYKQPRMFIRTNGVAGAGSPPPYAWTQQYQDEEGVFADDPNGQQGSKLDNPAFMADQSRNVPDGTICECVQHYGGWLIAWPLVESAPVAIPVPTITDPTRSMAAGPYFDFTSADGTVAIKAAGKTVDFSASLGPMLQFCIPDCNGNPQCFQIPEAFYVGPGPCPGSGSPVTALWYCLEPPAPGSGGPINPCGPCAVTDTQYCITYAAFDPDFADFEGCDVFATAGYQTVTKIGPCTWVWQEDGLPCAITFGFVGTNAFVQFGNAPNEEQLGRYEASALKWDCLTGSLTLPLTDPSLWPNSPPSITIYPNACPPPTPPCSNCANPPEFVCLTVPSLTVVFVGNGACGLCAALAVGITLSYSTNIEIATGEFSCGWVAVYPAGNGCDDELIPDHDNPIQLYWNPLTALWTLDAGLYAVQYTAAAWDCSSPLTLNLVTTNPANDCDKWPENVTVVPGPCSLGSGSGAQALWYCLQAPIPGSGSGGGPPPVPGCSNTMTRYPLGTFDSGGSVASLTIPLTIPADGILILMLADSLGILNGDTGQLLYNGTDFAASFSPLSLGAGSQSMAIYGLNVTAGSGNLVITPPSDDTFIGCLILASNATFLWDVIDSNSGSASQPDSNAINPAQCDYMNAAFLTATGAGVWTNGFAAGQSVFNAAVGHLTEGFQFNGPGMYNAQLTGTDVWVGGVVGTHP